MEGRKVVTPLRHQSDVLVDTARETLDSALERIGLVIHETELFRLGGGPGSPKFDGARYRFVSGTKLEVTLRNGDVVTFCSDVTIACLL